MSSFIVSKRTVDNILSFLVKYKSNERIKFHWKSLTNDGFYSQELLNDFGNKLFSLNFKAYNGRYNAKCEHENVYVFNKVKCSDAQAWQSLRCFTYQCAEDVTKNEEIYMHLEFLEKEIPEIILEESKAYKVARWDDDR